MEVKKRPRYVLEYVLVFLMAAGGFIAISLLCNYFTARHEYKISQLESNLFFIEENQKYDLTILGISHARNFSRQANHEISEEFLNQKIINLGRGNALCGMRGQELYLDFFYEKGNETKEILLVASPPLLYGTYLDSVDIAFWDEPIRADFVSFFLKKEGWGGVSKMFYHFRNKLRPSWLKLEKYPSGKNEIRLEKLDTTAIREGFELSRPNGRTPEMLLENTDYFKNIAEKAAAQKSELIVMIPPAAFGKWEGHEEVWTALKNLKNQYDFKLLDFSESVTNLDFYYDHHHLNTAGIQYFLKEKYLPEL